MSFGQLNALTIEQDNAVKVHVIGGKIIAAMTGWVGLSQRCVAKIKALHNGNKLNMSSPIEQATTISAEMIVEFQRTPSALNHQPGHGWGLGCLLAMPLNNKPELFEFDSLTFNPERKGDPDGDGIDTTSRIVSMGSGQRLADPFLGFVRRAFWPQRDTKPKVADAKLAVGWTLQHAIDLNTGGVGGDIQMAVLEKVGKDWKASKVDKGEIEGQIDDLMRHLAKYREDFISQSAGPEAGPLPPAKK